MGLLEASATNIISMVGVGPFLTIPFMIQAMNGPHILYPWIAGIVLCVADGLVYAQLGAALPGSGGPYLYLREAFRPFGLARLMGFFFIFQTILIAPLSVAGAAVGFVDYLQFAWASMTPVQHNALAAATCVLATAALWRDTESIGRLAVLMLWGVVVTMGWVLVAGFMAFSPAQAFDFPPRAYALDSDMVVRLGAASVLAMYNYGGYNQVCFIGEEIRDPGRVIPHSILLSIFVVAAMYIAMSIVMLGVIPWEEAAETRQIASIFVARTIGDPELARLAGGAMTALILFLAGAALYALVLGYSRVPFAAARDGDFFRVFAKVHPTKNFPHVSLAVICVVSIPFCFFSFGQLASWLIQVQILLRFVWQCVAVILLRRYRPDIPQPFTMWLYPWPAILSLVMWLYIFVTGPREGILFSFAFLALTLVAYAIFSRASRTEPRT
jgi:APA family basic amino acid/polyamine antiporter